MIWTATRKRFGQAERIREFGEKLRDSKLVHLFRRPTGPDMRMNDGWTPEDLERPAREYGDGGDCWWAGCGR